MIPPSDPRGLPVTRRDFLAYGSAGLVAATGFDPAEGPPNSPERPPEEPKAAPAPRPWYRRAWRRAVIDMHIPDWDDRFLSEFDPDEYVGRLLESRAQSVVCYAHSHVGMFNYPTDVGKQHRGLKGRDIVAEIVERCRRHKIAVQLYSSLIHDRWAFDNHPEWRMTRHDGVEYSTGSRYGVVCPNSGYRDYVRRWVREMAERFDVDGFRFDMTFWIGVCYCDDCAARWAKEVGGEIPRTVDWTEERWVRLQHGREEWLADFAAICTREVKGARPEASVEHQASTFPLNWNYGVSRPLVARNDFLQGDFYGDQLQGSFVRKLLSELTPDRPFGYETSFSVDLHDHTGRKSEELLEAKAASAIADAAAFIFIDAIDPVGTVNPNSHRRMGRVFDRLMPYYDHLGGERVADVAIYYSLDSKFNMASNGKPIGQVDGSDAHTSAAMSAARRLIAGHRPFTVLTRKDLNDLGRRKLLRLMILPNVNHMDEEEADAIRAFVRGGGSLYASGGTSLVDTSGRKREDFQLADVLGVSVVRADWADRDHYVAPTAAGRPYFGEWTEKYPAFVNGPGFEVRAHDGAEVLATTTLPWPAPDSRAFSSIHSNPPWLPSDRPEVVLSRFGQGRAVYSASLIENVEGLKDVFLSLVRLLDPNAVVELKAPPAVEVTLFHQPDRSRYVLTLVNFQHDLPNIPVDGIEVGLPGRVRAIRLLPDGQPIPHETREGFTRFVAPRLETLAMFSIEPT